MNKLVFPPSKVLLFEVLERSVRLFSHVERSCKVVARPGARTTAQLKLGLQVQSFLLRHIERTLGRYQANDAKNETSQQDLIDDLQNLAEVHTRLLVAVPRPHEPIEIVSYLRQTLQNKPQDSIQPHVNILPEIFASENLGDQAHWLDRYLRPALLDRESELRRESKTAVAEGHLVEFAERQLTQPISKSPRSEIEFISLPRMDLGNPCRWSSLLHEIGHFHLDLDKVWVDFKSFCGTETFNTARNQIRSVCSSDDDATVEEELKSWLRECWCDAYAVVNAGPAVFFAQMHAFIFGSPNYLTERKQGAHYPPAWFRLRLLLSLSQSRFDVEDDVKQVVCRYMRQEKELIYSLFEIDEQAHPDLFSLLHVVRGFIHRQFPRNDWPLEANISSPALTYLVEDIRQGLPIPSISLISEDGQRAANPAEILLAGWVHRCTAYREDFLNIVEEWLTSTAKLEDLLKALRAKVDRADESLKRSLQMAEWFRILEKSAKQDPVPPPDVTNPDVAIPDVMRPHVPGLLSDVQIHELLESRALRIIPLIDSERQICGSVVDVRLGHNFEIFFSNVHGAIDPLNQGVKHHPAFSDAIDTRSLIEPDSMEMDVDFLDSISIGPGQFILGHTLEYIKLPNDVAAQIEGRSSFARLGLQIHMTANLVEAGFDGCLTLEIANCGHSTIKLYPGMRIAQLRFFKMVSAPNTPYGKMSGTKYRGMLSHNKTQQFSDWEIKAFKEANCRYKNNS